MLIQFATWALLFVVTSAIGRGFLFVVGRAGPAPRCAPVDEFTTAWLGLAIVIGALELASLVTHIGTICVIALTLMAAAGLPSAALAWRRDLDRALRHSAFGTMMIVVWIAVASCLVALGANEPVGLGDTCSTHIQQVKWARDYGAVIGLGNLNSKLAFDQSAHLLAALLDRGPWRDRSVRVAVPFFLWLALVQWAVTIARSSRSDADLRAKIFSALTLPYLIGKTHALELPSFSGDLPMACVALATGAALFRLPFVPWVRLRACLRRHAEEVVAIGALSALLVTIKLSGAMLLFLGFGILARYAWTTTPRRRVLAAAVPAVLLVGMLARRAFLSGWLLFPLPFGDLHLPWSIARHEAVDQYLWIRSWARLADHSPAEIAARGFYFWFIPWFEDFRRQPELTIAFVGAVLATVRLTSSLRYKVPLTPIETGILGSFALSIAYWFFGAPDLRFGGVFIWMFAAAAAVPLLSFGYFAGTGSRLALMGAALALLLTTTGDWLTLKHAPAWTSTEPTHVSFATVPFVIENDTASFTVYVPSSGRAYCGDSPLPCTPFPARQKLRRPGVLASGFLP